MPGPLHGVRILDLTTMMSGPLATMLLADQGAEVIKIETPTGELMRKVGGTRHGLSDSFQCSNRGKRSLSIDIKSAAGLQVVKKLVATADVLLENFRPGAVERMGLGENVVRQLRPDIIFVSVNGVGESGPYADMRTYDPMIQALSGLAEIQADKDTGRPRMVRTVICDKTTALTAAQAVTAALFERQQSGKGQHVRVSMLDAMVAYLWPEGMAPLTFVGQEQDPASGQLGGDLVYQAADRYITAGAVTDAEWHGMCRALDRLDLLEDPRFKTPDGRFRNMDVRRDITASEIRKWKAAEILARLKQHDVPSAPVLDRRELEQDPQIVHNEIIARYDDPVLGAVRQARPAARFDRTPAEPTAMAPFLGADNASLLGELGYSESEIADLTADGVLGHKPPEE